MKKKRTPAHYLIRLSGREDTCELTERLTEQMERHGLCSFESRDKYLYFEPDGTMQQIKEILAKIRTSAVYTEHFRGVVAMDLSELIGYAQDAQTKTLAKGLSQIGKEAGLLLFVNRECPELENALKEEIEDLMRTEEWGLKRER